MKVRRFKNEKYSKLADVEHKFEAKTLKANGEDVATEIIIYGDIGDYWWGSTSAKDVEQTLKSVTTDTIHVHINSPGGDAFEGIAIYNQLKNHSAKIIIHIDGLAASAASVVAMSADELVMSTGSMLMIHEASVLAAGTKKELKSWVNALEGLDKSLADIYMTRFKGERSEIEAFIENETWFTADEAVTVGLADKLNEVDETVPVDPEDFKNSVLARFKKAPPAKTNKNILENFKRRV